MRLARQHDVALIGGDTTRGPLAICVQVLGEVPAGEALMRSGARPGDEVWVSGRIGDAALAVAARKRRVKLGAHELVRLQRHLDAPVPRIALGRALRRIAHSAIDVSDGLCADLGHICERSRVSAVIEFARLPVSRVMKKRLDLPVARSALLAGGDDYELCFTAGPERRKAVLAAARRAAVPVTAIGHIERSASRRPEVRVVDRTGRLMRVESDGYDHFR
jgi:thiamine-monophosphate kinase